MASPPIARNSSTTTSTAPPHGGSCAVLPSSLPVLGAFIKLFSEFSRVPVTSIQRTQPGPAFSPLYFLDLVKTHPQWKMTTGHQQDAQELLMFLLDTLQSEILELQTSDEAKSVAADDVHDDANDGWCEVTKKNKSRTVTEISVGSRTAISCIFSGMLGSNVTRRGGASTVTKQPFNVLPINLTSSSVTSIEQALRAASVCEYVEQESGAAQQHVVQIETAPLVLILNVKRWSYSSNGMLHKNNRYLTFGMRLVLSKVVFPNGNPNERNYRLSSFIVHLGDDHRSGHYIAYIALHDYPNSGATQWLEFNDHKVKPVTEQFVQQQPAYVLIYTQEQVSKTAPVPHAIGPPPHSIEHCAAATAAAVAVNATVHAPPLVVVPANASEALCSCPGSSTTFDVPNNKKGRKGKRKKKGKKMEE
jgi:ubiquitin C-terminal hydrolase